MEARDRTRITETLEAMAAALDLERGLLESRPWEIVISDDHEVVRLKEQLNQETGGHRQQITDLLTQVRRAA